VFSPARSLTVGQSKLSRSAYEEEAGARSKLEPQVSRGLRNPGGSNKHKEEAEAKPRWEPEVCGVVQCSGGRIQCEAFDPVATDKSDVENELQSGSSILVLESTPSRRSHRALFCLRHKLNGIVNIESELLVYEVPDTLILHIY
jgi:hypothetical protein